MGPPEALSGGLTNQCRICAFQTDASKGGPEMKSRKAPGLRKRGSE